MGFTDVDSAKAAEIARRLAQIISNNGGHWHGEYVVQAISENKPNAATVTGALLLYAGSDYTSDTTRDRIRGLLLAYRDQLLATELMECQENLAASTDKLSRQMFWVAIIGVIVAVVGAAAAVISIWPHR